MVSKVLGHCSPEKQQSSSSLTKMKTLPCVIPVVLSQASPREQPFSTCRWVATATRLQKKHKMQLLPKYRLITEAIKAERRRRRRRIKEVALTRRRIQM